MARVLLQMQAISKSFPGVKALQRVDLTLAEGSVHALVGKNGAGKSTLMKILSGEYAPDNGTIAIGDAEVLFSGPSDAHKAGIAIVHQELSLIPDVTVAENIFLGRWAKSGRPIIDWKGLNQEARQVLAQLDDKIDPRWPVSGLSIAQQQLVEIAKALARNPRILILDEPTSALSEKDAERLIEIIRKLASKGVGIIYISHRLAEIEAVADRVTVLRDGQTVGGGAIGDLDRRQIVQLMLGEELMHTPPPLRASSSEVVLSARGLSRRRALDDISFDLHRGEILGIAGLIGAGRSELVRALFGVDKVDKGEVRIHGLMVKRPSPSKMKRLGVAFLPEDRKRQSLILDFSIRENMTLTVLRKLCNGLFISRKKEESLVQKLMRDLQVAAANSEVAVKTLSGGNQQKIAMAKWLATMPEILILDEPTRGIDVQAKAQIFHILEALAAEGLAIIFISSEIEEVLLVSHRIITMARGRIISTTAAHDADLADIMLCATL